MLPAVNKVCRSIYTAIIPRRDRKSGQSQLYLPVFTKENAILRHEVILVAIQTQIAGGTAVQHGFALFDITKASGIDHILIKDTMPGM